MSKATELLAETAEWLEKQGRGLGNSFEYQGGSRIETEYHQRAGRLRVLAKYLERRVFLEPALHDFGPGNCQAELVYVLTILGQDSDDALRQMQSELDKQDGRVMLE